MNLITSTKFALGLVAVLSALSGALGSAPANEIHVIVAPGAEPPVKLAAQELASYLGRLYPEMRFTFSSNAMAPSDAGEVIRVGCIGSDPSLGAFLKEERPTAADSFVVTSTRRDGRETGIVVGADPGGTVHGVYALLTKLGAGFYLSYDAVPMKTEPFSFDEWELADAPLVSDRIVFDWHNFLSGCSTWNLEHWKSWISQSQKAGYNGIMVHAYGNNPMVSFEFSGHTKPVGYLSTTVKGRDWSTQHVNDVRRLYGGQVFDGPIFGPEAALVPDDHRSEATRQLMSQVFAFAEQRGVNVFLAVDVDTTSANPQALIKTLPSDARFSMQVPAMQWMNQEAGELWLANPDTPAGYTYYKEMVRAQLSAYPQVDCLVVWFRHNTTPWMAFEVSEMPEEWQTEFRQELAATPQAERLWRSHNFFALGKILKVFDRALVELGRTDVRLAAGSWLFQFLPPADRFLPKTVTFLPLDYEVLHDESQMDTPEKRAAIAEVAVNRPVVPVVWAHHDDGNYVGRPYTPYSDFHDKLVESKAAGFGIIHWTTRPLDLYFASLSEQVWHSTQNRPLRETCRSMAARSFGETNRRTMGEYLYRWVSEAPKIGRETGDFFIDRELGDLDAVIAGQEARTRLLNEAAANTDDRAALERIGYFKGLERFIVDVYRAEAALAAAKAHFQANDIQAARDAMQSCRPGEVIEQFAEFSSLGGITRGEQGLVVSMNLRWWPHFVRFQQSLGLEPIRYNFTTTSHDPLAQSPGTFTFHIGPDRNLWQCLGTKETGASVFVVDDDRLLTAADGLTESEIEIYRSGLHSGQPIHLVLTPILARGGRESEASGRLRPGRYRLDLLFLDPISTGPGQRVFEISLDNAQPAKRIDVFERTGGRNRPVKLSLPVEVGSSGKVELTVNPVAGEALLSGVVLKLVD